MKIRFEITPIAKQSANYHIYNGKLVGYPKKKPAMFEKEVRALAIAFNQKEKFYTEEPIIIKRLIFSFPWLKTEKKSNIEKGFMLKSTRPDKDNLEKALWDSLEGIFFKNDSQICGCDYMRKIYSDKGYIELEMVTEEEYNKRNNEVLGIMARGMTNI